MMKKIEANDLHLNNENLIRTLELIEETVHRDQLNETKKNLAIGFAGVAIIFLSISAAVVSKVLPKIIRKTANI